MRLIITVALATGLAVSQFQVEATAAGPPLPQQQKQITRADCGTASAAGSTGDPGQHMAGPGCRPAGFASRLEERRPGFWTADDVAAPPGEVASEAPPAIFRAGPSQTSTNAPACPSYPLMVVISGEPREATVVACPQPDGSWQVTQYTPGLPTQSFTVPSEPAAGSSPDDLGTGGDFANWGSAPAWDWAAQPWFFGFAPSLLVGQQFNRLHHFRHEFGRGEFGRHEFGRGEFGRGEFGRGEFGRHEFGHGEFGRHEFGHGEFGRGEFGRGFSRGFARGAVAGNRVITGRNFAVGRGFVAGRR
ncbi:MAG TPA: hypothetical protein VGI28_10020 [Stellaceae bacterium]